MFDILTLASRLLPWRENITAAELQSTALLLALCLTTLVVFNKRD
jgi:hypothetical protein